MPRQHTHDEVMTSFGVHGFSRWIVRSGADGGALDKRKRRAIARGAGPRRYRHREGKCSSSHSGGMRPPVAPSPSVPSRAEISVCAYVCYEVVFLSLCIPLRTSTCLVPVQLCSFIRSGSQLTAVVMLFCSFLSKKTSGT